MCEYWATNLHANVADIAVKAQSQLAIQTDFVKPASFGNQALQSKFFALRSWNESSANVVDPESSSSLTRNTRHKSSYCRSNPSHVIPANTNLPTFTRTSIPSTYSTFPSLPSYACKSFLDQFHRTLACPLFPREAITNLATIRANKANKNGLRPS